MNVSPRTALGLAVTGVEDIAIDGHWLLPVLTAVP